MEVLATIPPNEKALVNAVKQLGCQDDIRVMFAYHVPQRDHIPEVCYKQAEPAPHLHIVIENNSGGKLQHYPPYRTVVRAAQKASLQVKSNTFAADQLPKVLAYLKKPAYYYLGTNCSEVGREWRRVPSNTQTGCTDPWDADDDVVAEGELGADALTGTGLIRFDAVNDWW